MNILCWCIWRRNSCYSWISWFLFYECWGCGLWNKIRLLFLKMKYMFINHPPTVGGTSNACIPNFDWHKLTDSSIGKSETSECFAFLPVASLYNINCPPMKNLSPETMKIFQIFPNTLAFLNYDYNHHFLKWPQTQNPQSYILRKHLRPSDQII